MRENDYHGFRAFWDRRATAYDRAFHETGSGGYVQRTRFAATLDLAGHGPGDALDAGMGPGRLCAELAVRGWTVSGVDVSAEMLARARERVPDAADRIVQAPIEQLPFPDGSFDLVVATGVLEYARVAEALTELARVLRPAGRAVVSYPNRRALYSVWKAGVYYRAVSATKRLARVRHSPPRVPDRIDPARFGQLLAAAGLEQACFAHVGFIPFVSPLDVIFPHTTVRAATMLEHRLPQLGPLFATQMMFCASKP